MIKKGIVDCITPIPKSPMSSFVANYRPVSITSGLYKVFERLVSVLLGQFMKRSGVLPTSQFAYRKVLGTCDALLSVSHTLQSALESRQEARIVHIDISSAFDRINQLLILYKLCSMGLQTTRSLQYSPFIDTVSIYVVLQYS